MLIRVRMAKYMHMQSSVSIFIGTSFVVKLLAFVQLAAISATILNAFPMVAKFVLIFLSPTASRLISILLKCPAFFLIKNAVVPGSKKKLSYNRIKYDRLSFISRATNAGYRTFHFSQPYLNRIFVSVLLANLTPTHIST